MKDTVTRACWIYAVGSDAENLLAYDEYDSKGNGDYFTNDLLMINRYTRSQAEKAAAEKGLKVFLIQLDKRQSGKVDAKISCMSDG
jgi:hypothetical protein